MSEYKGTSQLVTTQAKVEAIRVMLDQKKTQLVAALPGDLSADRLTRIALTCIQRDPGLLECTPASVYDAILQSAQLGLMPDHVQGMAYLIAFYDKHSKTKKAQLMPGYKGLLDLAYRSKRVAWIWPEVVRTGDEFEYQYGTQAFVRHVPKLGHEGRRVLQFAYCIAKVVNESLPVFTVMTKGDIADIRKRSRADQGGFSPWKTDEPAMWKKTAIRQVVKYLPQSTELATAVALDERADAGIYTELPTEPVVDVEVTKEEEGGSPETT